MGKFRLVGRHLPSWYVRPALMGLVAAAVGVYGVDLMLTVGGTAGIQGGLVLVTAAVALGAVARASLWFRPPEAEIGADGTVTLCWPRCRVSVHATDITALRWIRPPSWRKRRVRRLEPFRIELGDRRIRLEAEPRAFHGFAQAIRLLNPRVVVNVPAPEDERVPAGYPG